MKAQGMMLFGHCEAVFPNAFCFKVVCALRVSLKYMEMPITALGNIVSVKDAVMGCAFRKSFGLK